MVTISQVTSPQQAQAVQDLLQEYISYISRLTLECSHAPTFQGLDEELASLPGPYAPPTGRLLLATHDGQPAGCIALKCHDADTGELKRLYVRPEFRGKHIGRSLVNTLIAEAKDAGYRRLVLDSHISMTTAHATYMNAGFRKVETPSDFPEDLKPIVVFMEMTLD